MTNRTRYDLRTRIVPNTHTQSYTREDLRALVAREPARSATTPPTGAKLGRDALTRFQQDSQRRFAFGYAGGAVQSVSPGVNVATPLVLQGNESGCL